MRNDSTAWHLSCHLERATPSFHMSNAHNEFEPRLGRSVSIDQAAQLLNVSRRTIYNRIKEGRLKTIRTPGQSRRVLLASLYALGFRPQAFPTSASAVTFSFRSVRN
jgi:excisionase family DNA binding protein